MVCVIYGSARIGMAFNTNVIFFHVRHAAE